MQLEKQWAYDEDIDVNNFLAIERTIMANDRTLLAFLRTSLYFSIAGITIPSLVTFRNAWLVELIFWIMAGITFLVGIWQYLHMKKKINASRERARALNNKSPAL